jgi:hypothetical protein
MCLLIKWVFIKHVVRMRPNSDRGWKSIRNWTKQRVLDSFIKLFTRWVLSIRIKGNLGLSKCLCYRNVWDTKLRSSELNRVGALSFLRAQTAGPFLARNFAEWNECTGTEVNDGSNPGNLILDVFWYYVGTRMLYSDYSTRSRRFYLVNCAPAFTISVPFTYLHSYSGLVV